MTVQCPYCNHNMRLKGEHPGRFKPACQRCGDQFLLVISAEPDTPPMVSPLDPSRRKSSRHKSRSPG